MERGVDAVGPTLAVPPMSWTRVGSHVRVTVVSRLRDSVRFFPEYLRLEMDRPAWRRLESKVVMVTGASSGIGHEICLDLAAAGCRVVAAARWIDRLRSLCDEIDGPGSPLLPPSSSFSARSTARSVAVELDVSAGGSVIEAAVQRA
ncbi:hypothetical protein GW17_00011565 [Ensete ventricosum]|nr:hypothetical protein GW17_00011565 [Ensete ventricosum]